MPSTKRTRFRFASLRACRASRDTTMVSSARQVKAAESLVLTVQKRGFMTRLQWGGQIAMYGRGRGACRSTDRKSTRLNSSHSQISYAVFCLKKKKKKVTKKCK